MIDYDKPADFSQSSMDELQAALVQSATDLITLSKRRDQLLGLLAQRRAQVLAKAKVGTLTPLERDALKTALSDTTPEPSAPAAVQTIDP